MLTAANENQFYCNFLIQDFLMLIYNSSNEAFFAAGIDVLVKAFFFT